MLSELLGINHDGRLCPKHQKGKFLLITESLLENEALAPPFPLEEDFESAFHPIINIYLV